MSTDLGVHNYQAVVPGTIELYSLDTTPIYEDWGQPSADILYFTNQADTGGQRIQFGGVTYEPVECTLTGLARGTDGAQPQPLLKVSNVLGLTAALQDTYGDLLGALVTRIQTFEAYLDGRPAADPTAMRSFTQLVVEQLTLQTVESVEWRLRSPIDNTRGELPRRRMWRDVCPLRYRDWNQPAFDWDYTKATCPYTGAAMFDENNLPLDPGFETRDECRRNLTACKLRFGTNPLPFGGFPGLGGPF